MTTYIVSFPHSGNHIVRALIEFMTKKETLGCAGNEHNDPPIASHLEMKDLLSNVCASTEFRKCHIFPKEGPEDKLIFIIRHPTEALCSRMRDYVPLEKISNFDLKELRVKVQEEYEHLVQGFQQWNRPKILLKFEDLVYNNQSRSIIEKLGEFVGAPSLNIIECIKQWPKIQTVTKSILARPGKSISSATFYRDATSASHLIENSVPTFKCFTFLLDLYKF